LKIILLIGTGSFLGGVLRYVISGFIQSKFLSSFPFGTLSVNFMGCLLIGLIYALSEKTMMSSEFRLFLATGICGGFTTFSAFSFETFALLRDGQFFFGFVYVLLSVFVCIAATLFGYFITKFF